MVCMLSSVPKHINTPGAPEAAVLQGTIGSHPFRASVGVVDGADVVGLDEGVDDGATEGPVLGRDDGNFDGLTDGASEGHTPQNPDFRKFCT